jgi:hypothetical protein
MHTEVSIGHPLTFGEFWRLTVVKRDLQHEFVFPRDSLALMDQFVRDREVIDLEVVSYHTTVYENVWMATLPRRIDSIPTLKELQQLDQPHQPARLANDFGRHHRWPTPNDQHRRKQAAA